MKEETTKKALSLKTLTKSTVWDVQENDIFRMLETADKDGELKENLRHIADIIRSAFMIEEIKEDNKALNEKYAKQGYKVGTFKLGEDAKMTWAIKKRPITRVTDLTYENIRHITAAKLLEVIDRNFGGGWDSLSQSIQDIIESGFDISTTTLPKDRLHKKGGMYEKKVADGFEVLEVAKGTWVEAIFAKLKPETLKPRMKWTTIVPPSTSVVATTMRTLRASPTLSPTSKAATLPVPSNNLKEPLTNLFLYDYSNRILARAHCIYRCFGHGLFLLPSDDGRR